jgi:hypothetical protein
MGGPIWRELILSSAWVLVLVRIRSRARGTPLRASGRGRCGWEPVTLLLVAIVPPGLLCVRPYFHPEDLLALGLALGGLACTRRGSWAWAGVLLGLSFTSQQFVLLIIAPLVVVAPSNRRLPFAGSAIISAMLVVGPMILLTSGRVIASVTGGGSTRSVLSPAWYVCFGHA